MPRMLPARAETTSALGPPQFRLRTLLIAVAGLSVLFAAMSAVGGYPSLVLLFFVCLIAAHVVGNALGTRLQSRRDDSEGPSHAGERLSGPIRPIAPAQRLQERTGLSRTMVVTAAIGSVSGACLGALALLVCCNWQQMGLTGLGLGIFSSAVLGGFFGFLAASFLAISRRALREALGKDG